MPKAIAPPYTPADPGVVDILEFTDPVCTWCWGSEPVLRALTHRFGDHVSVGFVMGGLVADIREFFDSRNNIGGGAAVSNPQIASHWVEASARHGMPVKADGFALFSDEFPSTYPQNEAYKAAQLQDVDKADRFLRRLREASAAEARVTSRPEVLAELASEVGLDVGAFLAAIDDGSAARAFAEDRRFIASYGVSGFPTFLVRYQGQETLLRGYQPLATFERLIAALTKGAVRPVVIGGSDDAVAGFIQKHEHVAPAEVAVAFGLDAAATAATLDRLAAAGVVTRRPAGKGEFVEAVQARPGLCDSATGVCRV